MSDESLLELKPLSSITNEDAASVALIIGSRPERENLIEIGITIAIGIVEKRLTSNHGVEIYQFLQYKGYALPYMGLSVDDLVEFGWVKLKQV